MIESIEEALKFLEETGGGAVDVFEGRSEDSWEWHPAYVEDRAWYEWCDDCETYHANWYVFGYEVTKGVVELVVWSVDQDGNWDIAEGAELETPGHKGLLKTYGEAAWRENYIAYLRHVAETGKDPCGDFLGPPTEERTESWAIYVVERAKMVWVTRGERIKATTGAVFEIYERLGNLPQYVQDYLLLEKRGEKGGFVAWAIDPENVKSIEALSDVEWHPVQGKEPSYMSIVSITRKVPAMTDEEWSAMLREKANKARAALAFSGS